MTKQKEADDREQKRYRTKAILAALGDGISSLANLYYTTRGAQGIPQPAASLSEVTKRRFDEAKRRKEKMEDEYRAALIRAGLPTGPRHSRQLGMTRIMLRQIDEQRQPEGPMPKNGKGSVSGMQSKMKRNVHTGSRRMKKNARQERPHRMPIVNPERGLHTAKTMQIVVVRAEARSNRPNSPMRRMPSTIWQ